MTRRGKGLPEISGRGRDSVPCQERSCELIDTLAFIGSERDFGVHKMRLLA